MRGRFHDLNGIPVRVTYHPSYLLRSDSPREKRKVWEDMLAVMERLDMPISEKTARLLPAQGITMGTPSCRPFPAAAVKQPSLHRKSVPAMPVLLFQPCSGASQKRRALSRLTPSMFRYRSRNREEERCPISS